MGFTKGHSDQNKKIATAAARYMAASGYNPAHECVGYSLPYVKKVTRMLQQDFPNVAVNRLSSRAVAAKRDIFAQWMKEKDNQ